MKVLSLVLGAAVVVGIGILSGLAFCHYRTGPAAISPTQTASETAAVQAPDPPARPEPAVAQPLGQAELPAPSAEPRAGARPVSLVSTTAMNVRLNKTLIDHAIDTLVSPQVTHEQRTAAWKQLQDSGKLDQAISELEQRAAADPRSPEAAAALGQACLRKCAAIQDIREQAILAMQADKAFDSALSLDPSNWDARFTKAVALSYWPANMNKGEEVIQHFETLIQQQEAQAPQAQYAETYSWLGDQYKKAGRTDDAKAIWQRGLGLFPNNAGLRIKLGSAQ